MAMKRVLVYLEYTQHYALHYNKYPAVIEGYNDANWMTGPNDVKSTSGYVFILGGGAVSWKSSKQTCIARFTMESEFIVLDKFGEKLNGFGISQRIFYFGPNLWDLFAYIAIVKQQ